MEVHGSARISDCGRYRWLLERWWGKPGRVLVCVGLNPSTADASEDDATIRLLVSLARREGYSRLAMLNLYAWRATDPRDLWRAEALGEDVQGGNDAWLRRWARTYPAPMLAAWGAPAPASRQREVYAMFAGARCLWVNKDGSPGHPLRKALTGLWPWTPALLPPS